MAGDARFDIPARPERRYPREGGLEYEGGATFVCTAGDRAEGTVDDLVRSVLSAGPYRWGDFADLPLPLYLVRDDETADTFRVSVRDGRVRLHVLPETDPPGLRRFHARLEDADGATWAVECRTEG